MRMPFPPKWMRTWSCLNDAQMAAFVDGTQSAGDRAKAERHLSDCADCRQAVALLLRSENVAGEVPPAWVARVRHLGSEQPTSSAGWRWAAATALLVLAGLGLTVAYRPKPQTEVAVAAPGPNNQSVDTQASADQVRKLTMPTVEPAILSPAEGQTVAHDAQVQWEPVGSAVDYEVRILNSAGDTLWKSKSAAPHVQLPGKLSTRSSEKYYVLIVANLPNGKSVRARAVSFHVRAEQE